MAYLKPNSLFVLAKTSHTAELKWVIKPVAVSFIVFNLIYLNQELEQRAIIYLVVHPALFFKNKVTSAVKL